LSKQTIVEKKQLVKQPWGEGVPVGEIAVCQNNKLMQKLII
jgi:hypothetical protein